MTYEEMLKGFADAGHDISGYTPAPQAVPAPARNDLVTIAVDDIAGAIDQALGREIEPLHKRIAALEKECKRLRELVEPPIEAKLAEMERKLARLSTPRAVLA